MGWVLSIIPLLLSFPFLFFSFLPFPFQKKRYRPVFVFVEVSIGLRECGYPYRQKQINLRTGTGRNQRRRLCFIREENPTHLNPHPERKTPGRKADKSTKDHHFGQKNAHNLHSGVPCRLFVYVVRGTKNRQLLAIVRDCARPSLCIPSRVKALMPRGGGKGDGRQCRGELRRGIGMAWRGREGWIVRGEDGGMSGA